jgi:hypothetical protein
MQPSEGIESARIGGRVWKRFKRAVINYRFRKSKTERKRVCTWASSDGLDMRWGIEYELDILNITSPMVGYSLLVLAIAITQSTERPQLFKHRKLDVGCHKLPAL